ncbi:YAP-binding/ALF4/Glomulin [Echria macrotheca]|uniref:YAP-binding/ALF4/Glomulin n=1 Tax=Echria macrotheca TaxID=438768 RepID=A0AAJ0BDR4_9PEZI|nr:YAP-binding/ALF4/Glomulin [Echria macrotheca]
MDTDLQNFDAASAIAAIRDARPPATDRFTYLTIVEANLIVDVLPTLNEILQDAELTQEIGWDLVFNLVNLPGSEACLETIARLGNPREVILKVLETLELLNVDRGDDDDDETQPDRPPSRIPQPSVPKEKKFVTLLGMLAILHKRLKTKFPSRFVAQTLETVYATYRPTREMTAAVINLVHSLSGRRRPALPSRKSSVNVADPERDGDESKNAPDPEAEVSKADENPDEAALQERMLLSFVTCVLEAYTTENEMGWAARLLEFYEPTKLVPGRKTLMGAFKEEQQLLERDAVVGNLAALIRDLGLDSCSRDFLEQIMKGPITNNPLSAVDSATSLEDIPLSAGGCVLLIAYWVFSATLFDADQPTPDINILPDHYNLLEKFLQDDAEGQIQNSPAVTEALVAIGLWLQANGHISSAGSEPQPNLITSADDPTSDFMRYIHLVTLIALYHPQLHVRNAASMLASSILHADPSEEDRLRIIYDLLENCTFASLKACAVTWLREEMLAASTKDSKPSSTVFATTQAFETLQYVLFPSLDTLAELDVSDLLEYMAQNAVFLLQSANFGLLLWLSADRWTNVLPANADATVRERWFQPLSGAVYRLRETLGSGADLAGGEEGALGPLKADLDVLADRLSRLGEAEGFKIAEEAERA